MERESSTLEVTDILGSGQGPRSTNGFSPGGGDRLAEAASCHRSAWTFLTNHAHVLLCLAQQPDMRIRDVAQFVGVTERCVQRILADLEEAGYVSRMHHGRRNFYEIHADLPLRHPVERHRQVSALLELMRYSTTPTAGTAEETTDQV